MALRHKFEIMFMSENCVKLMDKTDKTMKKDQIFDVFKK